MRFGTSLFNWPVFKKTVLRYWPLWGAYSAVWLVAMPLQGLMMLQLEAQARPGVTDGYLKSFAQHTVPDMAGLSLPLAVVFGLLSAMAVCSHLYNPRSANFFGALPVRREGLFVTHYLAGLVFLIVPNAVIFLLTLLVEAAGGAVFLPGLGFWLAAACGEGLFFYSMAVFCGMFTGHILALPAFYGIFNALAYGVYVLVNLVFRRFYYGFAGFSGGADTAVVWLTPVLRLGRSVSFHLETADRIDPATGAYLAGAPVLNGLSEVAAYAAAAVVLAAGSFLLYRIRRLESAGEVVSVKAMRPVFQYGVAFCAGLAFGMFTTAFLGGKESTLMASILVWAVIGYFAARMLLEKSFRVLRFWKGAAASAGVFVLLFLVVGFDLTGFETRVPNPDQVDYVELEGFWVTRLNDSGDYGSMKGSNPALVEHIILLHRAAMDQRDGRPAGTTANTTFQVTYHLKNGGQLSRNYDNVWIDPRQTEQEGAAAWAIQQMYNDRELSWQNYGFAEAERRMSEAGWRLQEAVYVNEDATQETDGEQALYYGGEDARALYEAVKEDFQAGRIGVRRVQDWNRVYDEHYLQFTFAGEGNVRWTVSIRVQDTASSTRAALAALAEPTGERAWTAGGAPDTQAQ